MKKSGTRASDGFTLFEMLVALGIFAILSAAMSMVYVQSIQSHSAAKEHLQRLAKVQLAFLMIGRSMEQTSARTIRDAYGDSQPPLAVQDGLDTSVELTQIGRLPLGFVGSGVARVAYGVQDEKLWRLQWPVLDRAQDTAPVKSLLLEDVNGMSMRYLDGKGEWHATWPADALDENQKNTLPQAVEVVVETKDWGKLRRVFLLTDSEPVKGNTP